MINKNAPTKLQWFMLDLWALLGYVLGEWCQDGCGHEGPYGFIPAGGCPIHDSEKRWHKPALWILLRLSGRYGLVLRNTYFFEHDEPAVD